MGKYAIGVDFGTLSARCLVAEIGTGRELASATMDYAHGVMSEYLPTGERLKVGFALQHPRDYMDCIACVVPEALKKAAIDPRDVVGLGIDFTACTLIALDGAGEPLCFREEFAHNPHAWVKLWKHHGAQREANSITRLAQERGEAFLARYGGRTSSEWMLPKIWETLNEAPDVYENTNRFMEAGDWLIMQLTGSESHAASTTGYKAMWSRAEGYPSGDFLKALDPRLENLVEDKLYTCILPQGAKAGEINARGAAITGLREGTAVAVTNIDAHVSMPATGSVESGSMLMIMGTSTCDIMVGDEERMVPGMCGAVQDGIVPGKLGYEAGQSCVGDHFNWFVENCVPADYVREADEKGMDLHMLLTEKAARLKPGESGLIALDWWNGNRSVLVDADLTGLMLGMTLNTRPEEMYRALIEATAYGARTIIETFGESGVPIKRLIACGGIARKNPFLMQIYADVLNRGIEVVRSAQAPALGAAMFGAVAAGSAGGGYDDIADAAREMGGVDDKKYMPIPENVEVYDRLYAEFKLLHDYFGRGGNDVMKRLKKIKEQQRG